MINPLIIGSNDNSSVAVTGLAVPSRKYCNSQNVNKAFAVAFVALGPNMLALNYRRNDNVLVRKKFFNYILLIFFKCKYLK